MTLVKVVIMAAMLSSSIAMAAETCEIHGLDGSKITGIGADKKAAKRDARLQCGAQALDTADTDIFDELSTACANKECE